MKLIDVDAFVSYMVGGFDFASYEIPKWFDNLKRCADGERKGGDE